LRLNQPEAALQSFDAALAVARKSGDLARQFNALVGRARAHVALDRLDDAEADLAEFNGLKEGQEAANGRAFAQSKAVAVELLLARGKLEEARRQGDSLLQELREATDTRHAELDFALLMSTRVAIADHRYGDAERAASEAVALYRKLARNPDASADVGEALLRLSEAERDLGEVDKAKGNAAAAVAPLTSGLGADHPLTLSATHLAGAQDI
jgi:tetratricopeptide (TPR) repeat protein